MQTHGKIIGYDTETRLIAPGNEAPVMVCLSYDDGTGHKGVDLAPQGVKRFAAWLADPRIVLVAHHGSFDAVVLMQAAYLYFGEEFGLHFAQLMFAAMAQGRVICTMLRQKLAELALGKMWKTHAKANLPSQAHLPAKKKAGVYSLAGCMWFHFKIDRGEDKAEGSVRYRYAEVEGVPVREWPPYFYKYALQDATDALHLYRRQQETYADSGCFRVEGDRCRAAFTLRLAEVWGLRTDGKEVEALHDYCTDVVNKIDVKLLAAGLMREKWAKGDLRYAKHEAMIRAEVAKAYAGAGVEPPLTKPSKTHPKGQIKLDSETLQGIPALYEGKDHPYGLLIEMSKASMARDILNKYNPALRLGTIVPLHAFYNPLLTTGRTSATKYVQTPPRSSLDCFGCGLSARKIPSGSPKCPKCGGYVADVRRCYVARKGYVYGFVDYDQLELCTLGQSQHDLHGSSAIGDAINQGLDLHCVLGEELMGEGIGYEEFKRRKNAGDKVCLDWRQWAKGGNFGLPGKLGVNGLIAYMRGYGVYLTKAQAKKLITIWTSKWSDMPTYFRAIKAMGLGVYGSKTTITHPRTGLIRGDVELPAACNFLFQGLAAAGALDAGFHLAWEMYAQPTSALYGSRNCFFLHDEWGAEHPETRAPEAADRQSQVQRDVMQRWCPNVAIRGAAPALSRRWYKGADEVRNAEGRLQLWTP